MKIKQYLISLLVASTPLTFAQVVNAQECPPLKSDTTKVLVTDNRAELRLKEDIKKNRSTTDRPEILKGNDLETIDIKDISSRIKNETECWYKVKSPINTDEYWIEKNYIDDSVLDLAALNRQPELKPEAPPPGEQNATNTPDFTPQNWSVILMGVTSVLSCFNLLFLIKVIGFPRRKQKANLKQTIDNLENEVKENGKKLQNIDQQVSRMGATLMRSQGKTHDKSETTGQQELVDKIDAIAAEVRNLSLAFREQELQSFQPTNEPSTDRTASHTFSSIMSSEFIPRRSLWEVNPIQTDSDLQTQLSNVITNFNQGNVDYFSDEKFIFLTPTPATSLGSQGVGIDARSQVEFQQVTENINQASYLAFITEENKTYLIPNILNNSWKQIIVKDENKIFEHSDSKILLKPAIIESVNNNIWRLKKPGEFQ